MLTRLLCGSVAALSLSLVTGPLSAAEFRALSSWDQSYVPRTALFEKFLKNSKWPPKAR